MSKRPTMQSAIKAVRDHFEEQCRSWLVTWHVISAIEDIAKGAFVIQCVECCAMEKGRAHEVWVDAQTGDIMHQHRIEAPEQFK